jgi:hypothetical protein
MDVVTLILNFLFGTFISLGNYFITWWSNASDAGFALRPFTLVIIFISIALYLSSGFAAMTFAEMKLRNRGLHFVAGLLLPFIYPLLFFYLASKLGSEKTNEEDEEKKNDLIEDDEESVEEKDIGKDLDLKPANAVIPESEFTKIDQPNDPISGGFPEPAIPVKMNQEFFARIARLEDGTAAGPFDLKLSDGTDLHILTIVDAMPKVLSVEIMVEDEVRKIRLPYARISDCVVLPN